MNWTQRRTWRDHRDRPGASAGRFGPLGLLARQALFLAAVGAVLWAAQSLVGSTGGGKADPHAGMAPQGGGESTDGARPPLPGAADHHATRTPSPPATRNTGPGPAESYHSSRTGDPNGPGADMAAGLASPRDVVGPGGSHRTT